MEQNHPIRILCLDDEPVVRQILHRALSPSYHITLLRSSKDLDETLESFMPDLMVLDIKMPDEDGWSVCNRLRADKRYDAIPILFLSALADESSVHKGYARGGDFFLTKPFDINELLEVVNVLVGRKHRFPDEDASYRS